MFDILKVLKFLVHNDRKKTEIFSSLVVLFDLSSIGLVLLFDMEMGIETVKVIVSLLLTVSWI